MKRNTLNNLLLLGSFLLVSQVLMAQPPPPHPGGSGNQGAPIENIALIAVAGALLAYKKKHKV